MAKQQNSSWYFITNHASVFFYLLRKPDATVRQVSDDLGIAERTVTGILADLRREGYVESHKVGKRNVYMLHTELPMRKRGESEYSLQEFFSTLPR